MEGLPSGLRIDPVTGLEVPPAVISARMNNAYMPSPNNLPPFSNLYLALQNTSQGFEQDTANIVQPYPPGLAYRVWFRPLFNGNFLPQGGISAYSTAADFCRVNIQLESWLAPNSGLQGLVDQLEFEKYVNVVTNDYWPLVGPVPQISPIINLRSDRWYSLKMRTSAVATNFNYACLAFLTLMEIL